MAVNDMSFAQASAILTSIHNQATGQIGIAPINAAQFVSVAQITLKQGYDVVLNSISQILSRTLFQSRAYTGSLKGLIGDTQAWGNHVRTLAACDLPPVDDVAYALTNGQSIDQFIVRKPEVLQLNYYGFATFSDFVTRFQDQLDVAFSAPEELLSFWSMIMTEMNNKHTQWKENLCRATLCNLIAGKSKGDSGNVLHLVTMYNDFAGTELDSETVLQPDNLVPFVQFICGVMQNISNKFKDRSSKYHQNVTGKILNRHTPQKNQRLYLLSDLVTLFKNSGFTNIYSPEYLNKFGSYEELSFWQDINTPKKIDSNPVYFAADGTLVNETGTERVQLDNVFGVLFDEEACRVCPKTYSVTPSPINARGRYYNLWYNDQLRHWVDYTQNCVVFILD